MPKHSSPSTSRTDDLSSDDSGELWIAPKLLPRAATIPNHKDVLTTKEEATTKPPSRHGRKKLDQPRRRLSPFQARHNNNTGLISLSIVQLLAWYVPRILFLFLVGWSWSVGVQLIHTQQKTLDVSSAPNPLTAAKTLVTSLAGKEASSGSSSSEDEESDDSDSPFMYWRQKLGSNKKQQQQQNAEFSRDLISRVLEHASWSNGISGVLTVVIGMAYPYLDTKWRSYPSHRIGWFEVLRCAGGFLGINYAALKLPFETAGQSAAIMLIISLGLWTVCDGTLHGLLLSTTGSLTATWMLYVHALNYYYASFSRDDYLSMLSYLPSVVFTYCVMVGSVGRRLGYHPLWKHYSRSQKRRQQ